MDECGSNIALTPLYGRAPKGKRLYGSVPRNRGANTTLLASLSLQGMGEAMILEGAADTLAFEVYIEQVLAPSLSAGQIVVLDNLSTHTGEKVRQALQACGCRLLFLPAYSPDLSPTLVGVLQTQGVLAPDGRTHAGGARRGHCSGTDDDYGSRCPRLVWALWLHACCPSRRRGKLTDRLNLSDYRCRNHRVY